jgi:hypothetical protein
MSATQWESVAAVHMSRYPEKGRSVDSLKRKFKELHIKQILTGDPHCPPSLHRAKRLRQLIILEMDGCDVNSLTEDISEMGEDATEGGVGVDEGGDAGRGIHWD